MDNLYKWRKDNQRVFKFELNKTKEKDVIDFLESLENKRAYIIDLIRKDINSRTNKTN